MCGGGGCALVAQSVEHRSYEPKVLGSIPNRSIKLEAYSKYIYHYL